MLLLDLVAIVFDLFPRTGGFAVLGAASGLALCMTVASILPLFNSALAANIWASSSSHCRGIHANLS